MDRFVNGNAKRPDRVLALLSKFSRIYEDRRKELPSPLPTARGFRIYRFEYDIDPWARNRNTPDRRVLLYEFETSLQEVAPS